MACRKRDSGKSLSPKGDKRTRALHANLAGVTSRNGKILEPVKVRGESQLMFAEPEKNQPSRTQRSTVSPSILAQKKNAESTSCA